MEIQELMQLLSNENIITSIHFNKEKEQCYIDLRTEAKSQLHLYSDGVICGRYGYEEQIDMNQDVDDLLHTLCREFRNALCGRDYYQQSWGSLCEKNGIRI